ncbi:hypothetical protein C4D60_Mb05t10580 [Musa balbisiana]|uniref:RING-type E3 ubiquitin transferase n=1 Tax=Musa balbisiana TaxID=52838 RepID=A0A4S8JV68_MUSBA|nr:hypothetical protein C4D60_Mb05t10580 [Musa balbisiana]
MEEGEKEAAVLAAAAAGSVVESLMAAVEEIAAISDYRNAYKKQFCNLSRRIKLLAPMFEELKESKDPIPPRAVRALEKLNGALDSAKDLLRLGSEGSKIFLVLERDRIMERFHEITSQLEVALNEISFNEIDISDEVKEQVELVHAQFKRAKERIDTTDPELYADLSSVCHMNADARIDSAILQRLTEKLQLMTISDLKQESLALHEMVDASGDPGEVIEKMSMLLKRIKDFVQTQKPEMSTPTSAKVIPSHGTSKTPLVPDDFRCPISLELMGDPVIVSTGQTYEREFIKKWLEAGHNTCPKTQQRLSSTSLTPNYVLRSLIAQWCQANGMDPPKLPARTGKPLSVCSAGEHAKVVDLLHKLSSQNLEDQRSAAGELRLLAKRNTDNRICIAEAGAIPLLVNLLSTQDVRIQEHAVTALLNLSIYEENKGKIIVSGAVPGIVHVLKRGSMEARENAAATLFSLSVPKGGKKDAATVTFQLVQLPGEQGKGCEGRAHGDTPSHPDGKAAIRAVEALPMLVKVIEWVTQEQGKMQQLSWCISVMGSSSSKHLAELQEQGMMVPLREMVESGTNRGKRKAAQLLEQMTGSWSSRRKQKLKRKTQAQLS